MPGQIISTPFLSQNEDMDKYLLEYRNLKLIHQSSNSFQSRNAPPHQSNYHSHYSQLKYSNTNGYYYNNSNSNSNPHNQAGLQSMNRSVSSSPYGAYNHNRPNEIPYMNAQKKHYRFNTNNNNLNQQKYKQYSQYSSNPVVTAHLKQTYPQLYYNSNANVHPNNNNNNNNSKNALYNQAQFSTRYFNSNSSPSLTSSTSNSSSPYNQTSFEYILPSTSAPSTNLSSSSSNNSTHTVPTTAASASTDLINDLPTVPSASSHVADSQPTPTIPFLPTNQALLMSSAAPGPIGANIRLPQSSPSPSLRDDFATAPANMSSSSSLLMNDSSLGWGSNHMNVSSSSQPASSRPFGIWNNDMSVWS
ncbi:YBL081W-like protein [Saccharomyces kudriavzevii IFO 1802]|uniref:YBL081W-like protein n=1 Tax=Saccharomyces kudriavzevii (strain ATCC MYA-4449 / AS 2.2408 / CBS 8840 / NBRC 1802 / NCYC 2889) TaxID=226230 RepID=J5RHY8_SACK1|nr:YBL081W-like protein [Saccharomyces kudriavzevii IFO 1802]